MPAPFASYPAIIQTSPDDITYTTVSGLTAFKFTPKMGTVDMTAMSGGGHAATLQTILDFDISLGVDYINGNVGQSNFLFLEGGICYVKLFFNDGSTWKTKCRVESYDFTIDTTNKVMATAKLVAAGTALTTATGVTLPTDALVAQATPAYSSTVSIVGTSTSLSAEAMGLVSGNIYQITNTAKRAIDPSVARTYKGNGVTIPANQVQSEDLLFGKVTFTQAETAPITMDTGNYLPITAVAVSKSFKLSVANKLIETTNLDSGGIADRIAGIGQAKGSFASFTLASTAVGVGTLVALLTGRTPILVQYYLGIGNKFRAWTVIESEDEALKPDAALEGSFSWVSTTKAGSASEAGYAWGAA